MRKGFTLIELLAVIVILAIIALIATPIVLNIIRDSKESASLRSAEMYLKGLETSIATSTLNNQKINNNTYSIMSDGNICLEYSEDKCINELKVEMNGEKPNSGTVTISNGQVIDLMLNYNNKTIVRNNNELVYSYKEGKNIEVPNLYNGTLTPVIYDGNSWVIADVTKKWYDYSKQEWANAVILDSSIDKDIGDPITVDGESSEVLAMLVWIPRYEYKIEGGFGKGGTSTSSPGEIEVNFINTSKKEASDIYRVHPAFNFGGTDIAGIWVGKFELSHSDSTKSTTSMNCTDENCSEGNNLRIIPNVQSLRNNNVSSFFYAVKSMNKSGNTFGIDNSITDTHMMKNSEWGAVAYLSQSKYGKYGNSDYIGTNKEIYINNSSDYYTGRSGGNATQPGTSEGTYKYNIDLNGTGASTTGNIYGIYDMSGGAWEYVMGVFANSEGALWSGNSSTANSGFIGKVGTAGDDIEGLEWPNEKYYEVYKASSGTSISSTTACNSGICYGHALSETAKWYGDYSNFVSASLPWFICGGYYSNGASAGVFNSSDYNGSAGGNRSARVVFTQ